MQLPYFLIAITCLVLGANRSQMNALTDGAVIMAGGVAEMYFCFLVAANHRLTKQDYRVVEAQSAAFWTINVAIVAVVHLFAYHCVYHQPFTGLLD